MVPHRPGPDERVVRVLAPNPGPMTLEGTNTWVVRDAGEAVVIDPGPALDDHLAALLAVVGRPRRLRVMVTHAHADHIELLPRFVRETGAEPVRPGDGEEIAVGALALRTVATPGHTSDSVSYWVDEPGRPATLLTGDTVLGRGTTVVAHPDGSIADYLATLHRLRRDVAERGTVRFLPGHGPVVDDGLRVLDTYLEHRATRLDQVRRALAAGARTAGDVVRSVYADLDPELRPAAESSVAAQLEYLSHGAGVNEPGGPAAPGPSRARPSPPT